MMIMEPQLLIDDRFGTGCGGSPRAVGSERSLTMFFGSAYIPKESDSKPLGEDAHFICHREQTFGVADGVGGWAHKGIDAGKYARKLMKKTAHEVRCSYDKHAYVNPVLALNEAFLDMTAPGSSTACVLTLRYDNVLSGINVGDSGFVVMRDSEIVYNSPMQQWRFNCPYQLGDENDDPSVGEELCFETQAWDIIVMGTDGLFDNVFGKEIEYLVTKGVDEYDKPDELASQIAMYALEKAKDKYCATPFSAAAQEAGKLHSGGKYDDITVLVAYVIPAGMEL